jgi:hypothetical protein
VTFGRASRFGAAGNRGCKLRACGKASRSVTRRLWSQHCDSVRYNRVYDV